MAASHLKKFSWLGLAVLVPLLALLANLLSQHRLSSQLYVQTRMELNLVAKELRDDVEKFSYLPLVMAKTGQVQDALLDPSTLDHHTLNQHLQYVNSVAETEDLYLINAEGLAIAASNWDQTLTFIGSNYSFRPYFQQAIAGQPARYFALGVDSGKRGYYFSAPVGPSDNKPIGVAVVKVAMDKIEANWREHPLKLLVADNNGVVFSSNEPNWLFSTLRSIDQGEIRDIQKNQQYPVDALKPLDIGGDATFADHSLLTIKSGSNTDEYAVVEQNLPSLGWTLYGLADTAAIKQQALIQTAVATLFGLLLWLLAMGVWWRRINLTEQFAFRHKTEAALIEARDKLEHRVNKRTEALRQTNSELKNEISERRQAEDMLRRTQNELIHAARLATLGNLSSGISHELNQPLAAISHYADNALHFSEQHQKDDVESNLREISKLTERMAEITTHLKHYSRKTDDALETVNLGDAARNALALLQPRIQSLDVTVENSVANEIMVRANSVRLEQVFVNLLTNALDAMMQTDSKILRLQQHDFEGEVNIEVHDSGTGIDADAMEHIFESFYTTKPVGMGLGLGLSISYSIVQRFGGALSVENSELGGACFSMRLKSAHV